MGPAILKSATQPKPEEKWGRREGSVLAREGLMGLEDITRAVLQNVRGVAKRTRANAP
jgi:hypothetical protein